jgi:hypothetical protein
MENMFRKIGNFAGDMMNWGPWHAWNCGGIHKDHFASSFGSLTSKIREKFKEFTKLIHDKLRSIAGF